MNRKVSACSTIKIAQQRGQRYIPLPRSQFHILESLHGKKGETSPMEVKISSIRLWTQQKQRLQTHEVSGLKAKATPATNRLAPNRYIGHSHPSGSGFSPGLMPQSHPEGGSNCDSLPWPPCRRDVMERLRAVIGSGLRAHRTARTVCRRRAICSECCWRGAPFVFCGLL